jgi:phosphatidylserine/phosphatidylglycerophosphate/cardiolipin synthase-like enzyme
MRAVIISALLFAGCVAPEEPVEVDDPNGLPVCASDQMHAIFDQTRSIIPRGTVSDEGFVTSRNHADGALLLDGPQIFPAIRHLIAGAKHDVNLQTYVWEPASDPANDIVAGLADLQKNRIAAGAKAPVDVRFLFDVSTLGQGSDAVLLPQAWAAVAALKLDPRYVRFELAGVIRAAAGVLHKKTVVVDGDRAIITGANPQAHHNYDQPWRDAGFSVSGEVVQALQEDFDSDWNDGKVWLCKGDEAGKLSDCTFATSPIVREPVPVAYAGDSCLPMLVTTRAPNTNPTNNRTDNPQDVAFLAAFGAATEHIHMQTPNLNDDAVKTALLDAVKRGVRVDIVLAKGFNDSTEAYPGQGGTNEENVAALYQAAGGRAACDKLRVRWHAHGGTAVVGNGNYATHAKYTSLDDKIVIVGTANMDTQSWNNSREINIVVDDANITASWDAGMFDKDFAAGVVVDQCK